MEHMYRYDSVSWQKNAGRGWGGCMAVCGMRMVFVCKNGISEGTIAGYLMRKNQVSKGKIPFGWFMDTVNKAEQ